MSQFNLNSAFDFAKVTNQLNQPLTGNATQGLLALAMGRNPSEWDIVEGSYKALDPANPKTRPILFHIFKSNSIYQAALPKITDKGGRRKVKYVFPYQDGQTTDDTGRKPQTFDLDIVFFGPNYKTGLQQFLTELNKPFPGTLKHPIRGDIQCVMEDYELVHSHEQRNAVGIHLMMCEHNFSLGSFLDSFKDSSLTSALTAALGVLNNVQTAISNVTAAILFPLLIQNQLKAALASFSNNFSLALQQLNQAFNGANANTIPGLLPVNVGGLNSTTGTPLSENFSVAVSPNDPFSSVSVGSQTTTANSITSTQATNSVNAIRDQINAIIALYDSDPTGQAPLEYYSDILNLKQSAILLQTALETAINSSQSQVISYVTPRLMSLREIAFANQLSLDTVIDMEILNAQTLLSTNYIPAGTTVLVPSS